MTDGMPGTGWFPDPSNSTQLRWWDGEVWTEQTRLAHPTDADPVSAPATGQPATFGAAGKKPWYLRWWAITAAVLIALSIVGSFLPDDDTAGVEASSSGPSAEADPATDSGSPEPEEEAEPVDSDGDGVNDDEDYRPDDAKIQSPVDVDTDKDGVPDFKDGFPKNAKYSKDADGDRVADQLDDFPKDAAYSTDSDGDRVADSEDAFPQDKTRSEITLAMENALAAAHDYLSFSPFSRQGLIDQLSSDFGSGFEVADAIWAVNQLDVDWKQQAVQAAKDYLEFSAFSRQGLIEQLSSSYGSKFTVEEATYAVNKIGL